jgi:hypothetical protein
MVKPAQFSKIAMAALVGSVVLFSHTQPADAFWLRKDTKLSPRLTPTDNCNYWRAQGRLCLPTPPNDRDKLCQWKFGTDNVWGQGVWLSYDTDCYRWRWFWE